jgi:hypothetical protein
MIQLTEKGNKGFDEIVYARSMLFIVASFVKFINFVWYIYDRKLVNERAEHIWYGLFLSIAEVEVEIGITIGRITGAQRFAEFADIFSFEEGLPYPLLGIFFKSTTFRTLAAGYYQVWSVSIP